MTSKEDLKAFIIKYLEGFGIIGSSGSSPVHPLLDYYSGDYLDFAEMDFSDYQDKKNKRDKEKALIGCVGNLKRAVTCEIECFFHFWNLRKEIRKRNLGIDRKLQFLRDVGILPIRTIERFITLRNKVEHDFQKPNLVDLESLFDVVRSAIALIQNASIISLGDSIDFEIFINEDDNPCGNFRMKYNSTKKKFTTEWKITGEHKEKKELSAEFLDIDTFTYFFRIWYLLFQIDSYPTFEYIRRKLDT